MDVDDRRLFQSVGGWVYRRWYDYWFTDPAPDLTYTTYARSRRDEEGAELVAIFAERAIDVERELGKLRREHAERQPRPAENTLSVSRATCTRSECHG